MTDTDRTATVIRLAQLPERLPYSVIAQRVGLSAQHVARIARAAGIHRLTK